MSCLIEGKIQKSDDFKKSFSTWSDSLSWLNLPLLSHEVLFAALEKIKIELNTKGDFYHQLRESLESKTNENANVLLKEITDFLSTEEIRSKLKRELGTYYPFELKRINYKEPIFESWFPEGVIVHVLPNNSPTLGVLALIEGLLTGSVNLLKLGRKENDFISLFFQKLTSKEIDSSEQIKKYIVIAQISSSDQKFLREFFSVADVASIWGGEESIEAIKSLLPNKAKVLEWGHKISFNYVTHSTMKDESVYEKIVKDICIVNQFACSSPQVVYVEDASYAELKSCAEYLRSAFTKYSSSFPIASPSQAESAELTVISEKVRLAGHLKNSELIVSEDKNWRIFVEENSTLRPSPLFRSVWLKPIKKNQLIEVLYPFKKYLQTVGLSATATEISSLSQLFFKAGLKRIRPVGEMLTSYSGESHDGAYALVQMMKRVSFLDGEHFSHLKGHAVVENTDKTNSLLKSHRTSIMTKEDYQKSLVAKEFSDLFFYSGGSSGEPKLSIFTYEDYDRQMELAAEGLFAAGLNPSSDRVMNLFYAGSLYGGFISFFSILEKLQVSHLPMGASPDFKFVGETIVQQKVNTILGMPSYIIQLFRENTDEFKKYRGIKKVFYGGEHFNKLQADELVKTFGVELIKSATYGSVDAGPLGYQCEYLTGGAHHLHERLHMLEIVDLANDRPVGVGEVGRLLFTSKVRKGQKIHRYQIGDIGREISGTCQCGRQGTRFELLGRHGDVFRIGTTFLSYQKFQKILTDELNFSGFFQLHLYPGGSLKSGENLEKLVIRIENTIDHKIDRDFFLKAYSDLNLVVNIDLVLEFEIEIVKKEELVFNQKSGKLKTVVDHRMSL